MLSADSTGRMVSVVWGTAVLKNVSVVWGTDSSVSDSFVWSCEDMTPEAARVAINGEN